VELVVDHRRCPFLPYYRGGIADKQKDPPRNARGLRIGTEASSGCSLAATRTMVLAADAPADNDQAGRHET
jgi:hypothetical protein